MLCHHGGFRTYDGGSSLGWGGGVWWVRKAGRTASLRWHLLCRLRLLRGPGGRGRGRWGTCLPEMGREAWWRCFSGTHQVALLPQPWSWWNPELLPGHSRCLTSSRPVGLSVGWVGESADSRAQQIWAGEKETASLAALQGNS